MKFISGRICAKPQGVGSTSANELLCHDRHLCAFVWPRVITSRRFIGTFRKALGITPQLELERSSQLHSETIQRPVRYMPDSGPIDRGASLRDSVPKTRCWKGSTECES
jgi:hypothetical protein